MTQDPTHGADSPKKNNKVYKDSLRDQVILAQAQQFLEVMQSKEIVESLRIKKVTENPLYRTDFNSTRNVNLS